MQPADTAVIILAAGLSTRAGGIAKLLATREDVTVLERAIGSATTATGSLPYVVTGGYRDTISPLLEGIAHEIYNPDYRNGMASSITAGIKALPENTAQVIIALADMPFVQATTYKALIKAADHHHDANIFVPTFNEKRGNPVLWKRPMFSDLAALSGDIGGRAIMQSNMDILKTVPIDDEGILQDMDTAEALARHGFTVKAP